MATAVLSLSEFLLPKGTRELFHDSGQNAASSHPLCLPRPNSQCFVNLLEQFLGAHFWGLALQLNPAVSKS